MFADVLTALGQKAKFRVDQRTSALAPKHSCAIARSAGSPTVSAVTGGKIVKT